MTGGEPLRSGSQAETQVGGVDLELGPKSQGPR